MKIAKFFFNRKNSKSVCIFKFLIHVLISDVIASIRDSPIIVVCDYSSMIVVDSFRFLFDFHSVFASSIRDSNSFNAISSFSLIAAELQ